jgi:hypothetical protein
MKPLTVAFAAVGLLIGVCAGYRLTTSHIAAKADSEERVLVERARGHITASEAEAIRTGLRLVRERDSGHLRPTTRGASGPYTVGVFYDKSGGRDLVIEGPPVSTVLADGPCIVTSLARWLRSGFTVAHCTKAGFESIVTITDLAGQRYIVALLSPDVENEMTTTAVTNR